MCLEALLHLKLLKQTAAVYERHIHTLANPKCTNSCCCRSSDASCLSGHVIVRRVSLAVNATRQEPVVHACSCASTRRRFVHIKNLRCGCVLQLLWAAAFTEATIFECVGPSIAGSDTVSDSSQAQAHCNSGLQHAGLDALITH